MVPRCEVHHAENVRLGVANAFEETSNKWDRPTRWFTTIEIAVVDAEPEGIGSSLYDDRVTVIHALTNEVARQAACVEERACLNVTLTVRSWRRSLAAPRIEADQAGSDAWSFCDAGRLAGLDPRSELAWKRRGRSLRRLGRAC
jgi:hypothetical protein